MAADAIEIKIDADTREAIKNLAALTKGLKETSDETDKLSKKQKELAEKQAKVSELFAKGFSDELPEKARNASAAFKLFGDSQLTAGDRAKALFAGLSVGKQVLAGYAGAVVGVVGSLVQMSAAAREAEVRLERQREIAGALGSATEAVAQATGGAASQSDAWAARTALLNAGLRVNAAELAAVVEGARRHREAGESNAESIERLVSVIRGEADAQERLGIVTRDGISNRERLTEVVRRLSDEQRRQGTVAETAAEQQARQTTNVQRAQDALLAGANELFNPVHNLLVAGGSAVDVFERGQAALQRWRTGAHASTQTANALGESTDQVKERTRAATTAQDAAAGSLANWKTKTMEMASAQERLNAELADGIRRAKEFQERAAAAPSFDPLGRETHAAAVDRNVNAGARARERRARSEALTRDSRAAYMRRYGVSRSQANRDLGISESAGNGDTSWMDEVDSINEIVRGERGAGRDLGQLSYARRTDDELDAEVAFLRQPITGETQRSVTQRPGESRTAYRRRLLAALRADQQGETAGYRSKVTDLAEYRRGRQIESDNALITKADEQSAFSRQQQIEADESSESKANDQRIFNRRQGEREDIGLQLRNRFIPAAEQTKTAAEQMAEGVSGAFDAMTNAVSAHVTAIVEGRESIGEALRGIAHDTLLSLAQMATREALMETARGIAKLAASYGTDPTAYGHFAAAGVYAAVAVGAGLGAYATGAPSGASAGAGGAGRTPPAAASAGLGSGQQGGGGATYIINVNGTVMDREGMSNAVLEGVNDAMSRGGVLRHAA